MTRNAIAITLTLGLALAGASQAGTILFEEDFENTSEQGELLQDVGRGWTATSYGLRIGSGTDINGTASLGYTAGWTANIYENNISYTLGAGEHFEVMWGMSTEPDGHGYRRYDSQYFRLYDGTDYVTFHMKSDDNGPDAGDTPVHYLGADIDGTTYADSAASEDLRYDRGDGRGIMYGKAVITPTQVTTYYSDDYGQTWTASGASMAAGLGEIDKVEFYQYTVGYWAVSDDWKMEVVPEPATLGLLGAGAIGLLLRRRSRQA